MREDLAKHGRSCENHLINPDWIRKHSNRELRMFWEVDWRPFLKLTMKASQFEHELLHDENESAKKTYEQEESTYFAASFTMCSEMSSR